MSTGNNDLQIRDKGANKGAVVILGAAYLFPSLTLGSNVMHLGNVATQKLNTAVTEDKVKSEDGVVRNTETSRELTSTSEMMERDKARVDFFALTVDGTTCLQWRDAGLVNGKQQDYFAIVKPVAQINIDTPGAAKSNVYKANHIAPGAAVTFTAGDLAAIETATGLTIAAPGPITIPINQEYLLIET